MGCAIVAQATATLASDAVAVDIQQVGEVHRTWAVVVVVVVVSRMGTLWPNGSDPHR